MNYWLLKLWSKQNNKKDKLIVFLFSKIQILFPLIKYCFYVIRKNKFIIKNFAFIYSV